MAVTHVAELAVRSAQASLVSTAILGIFVPMTGVSSVVSSVVIVAVFLASDLLLDWLQERSKSVVRSLLWRALLWLPKAGLPFAYSISAYYLIHGTPISILPQLLLHHWKEFLLFGGLAAASTLYVFGLASLKREKAAGFSVERAR